MAMRGVAHACYFKDLTVCILVKMKFAHLQNKSQNRADEKPYM